MATDEQRHNSARENGKAPRYCMALTPKVLADLQVCISSVELLEVTSLPAEAHLPLRRLSGAVNALVAAANAARRPDASIEGSLSVGSRAERS